MVLPALVAALAGGAPRFRPPSVPLLSQSPLVNVWSSFDSLYGGPTRFWNGAPNEMVALVGLHYGPYPSG